MSRVIASGLLIKKTTRIGGVVCGATGFFAGKEISETVYDWIFTPLEKEEWVIFQE